MLSAAVLTPPCLRALNINALSLVGLSIAQGLALQEEGEAEPKAKPTTRSTPRLPGVPAEPTPDLLRPQAQPRPKKAKTVPAQRRSRVVRDKQVGPPSRPTDATKGRVIRHVHVGGTRVTLSVPIKCPGCKRRVLSQVGWVVSSNNELARGGQRCDKCTSWLVPSA